MTVGQLLAQDGRDNPVARIIAAREASPIGGTVWPRALVPPRCRSSNPRRSEGSETRFTVR